MTATTPKMRLASGGSLQNRMAEVGVNGQPDPQPGMGATELMYTDTHACTILSVKGNAVLVQRDKATRTDSNGRSDAQTYAYTPDPNGLLRIYTKRRTGQWILKGDSLRSGQVLAIGYRREYHDYGF